jgi:hypothetical protein
MGKRDGGVAVEQSVRDWRNLWHTCIDDDPHHDFDDQLSGLIYEAVF